MDNVKSQFISELNSLEKLVDFYNSEFNLLRINAEGCDSLTEFKTDFHEFYSQKKIFNYNSLIISLYGYFEKFIENILVEYIDKINIIFNRYSSLPEPIVKNHLRLSLELIEKTQNSRYSGSLNKEGIIKNLHECINVNENYQLNKEAFSQHSANFRLQVVDEIFSRVGIESISNRIRKVPEFVNYIKDKYEVAEIQELGNDEINTILNDLAERRNEVAHGVPSQILSNDIIIDYIEYFDHLSNALIEVVNKSIYTLDVEQNCVLINDIRNTYRNGEVICLDSNNLRFSNGDVIYGVNSDTICKSKILNIQRVDVDIETTDETENYEVGLLIDKPFKKNYKVYINNATQQ
ncbi:MAE_28990/MAE_18760 family HEPN-like nuclease [Sunxiuqinia elliptica]|uniref:RiboL-PSP-HEPN domain-containing protein n=1 Tax=Sunxiuqinia elliptica TaxID=655355 RepID=A0A1I2HP83_9BACT|nr:MAE_28990/MAE_18760 family HEPN-like nuclease [Sunxiuqinia elliptica]SFF30536.1 hypothetical protein SAMN05216283_104147 [Sunxiuqinia elliptica]